MLMKFQQKMALQQVILFVLLITGVSASSVSNFTNYTEPVSVFETCQTPECLALSAQITRHMNLSADPCEDFNSYACGNYAASTLYDPGTVTWSKYTNEPSVMQSGVHSVRSQMDRRVFELLYAHRRVNSLDPDVDRMYRLARDLFRSCSSWVRRRGQQFKYPNSGRETSQDLFDGVLAHLFDDINRQESNGTFEAALAKMVRLAVWPMIEVGPVVYPPYSILGGSNSAARRRNASKVRLAIDLDRYSRKVNYTDFAAFFSTLPSAFRLSLHSPERFAGVVDELKTKFTIDYDLPEEEVKLRWSNCSAAADILAADGMDLTIRQLDDLSRCAAQDDPFSWTMFFDGVLDGIVDQDTPIQVRTGPMGVLIYASNVIDVVTYFKSRSFSTDPEMKLSAHYSFLILDWLLSFANYLPADLRAQWLSQNKVAAKAVELEDDPIDSCIQLTKSLLGPVVEQMYQRAYHSEYFNDVRRLVELVQSATIRNVQQQDWITQSAKEAIADKVMAMRNEIGFDVVPDDQLKTFYASTIRSLKASSNDSSSNRNFGAMFSLALCAYAGRLNNLLAASDGSTSFFVRFSGLIVNAFSYTRGNQIIFPMGILAPFLYHSSYPDYLNLGGIGVVIGHEIGHGFDDLGHKLNKQGARGHFWDNVTEAGYLKRMQCVTDRYGKYEIVPGVPHKSRLTRGNDISDLMGIQSAFVAMQQQRQWDAGRPSLRLPNLPESLTPDRLFFIQAAQPYCFKAEREVVMEKYMYSKHSPPHLRIRGMMENSADFARVFQCRPNQRMNPAKKCAFW